LFYKKNWNPNVKTRDFFKVDDKNKYIPGEPNICDKINIYNLDNPSFCYLFVSKLEQTIKKLYESYKLIMREHPNISNEMDKFIKLMIQGYQMITGLPIYNDKGEDSLYDDFYIAKILSKDDIFKPCYNNDVDNNKCELLAEHKNNKNKNQDYINWLNNWRLGSAPFPFSGLGYTYNYYETRDNLVEQINPKVQGLDELIVKPGREIKMVGVNDLKYIIIFLIDEFGKIVDDQTLDKQIIDIQNKIIKQVDLNALPKK
jgi:hypothetical protein